MSRKTTAEEFVRAWNGADYVEDVAEQLGVEVESVRSRASDYARKGVPLKQLTKKGSVGRLDLDALRAIGEETLPDGAKLMQSRKKSKTAAEPATELPPEEPKSAAKK